MRRWFAQASVVVFAALTVTVSGAFTGCATYSGSLARGQRAFEDGELERALAIFRFLEVDLDRLSPGERAQYAYLRGTVDYRMGYRSDARHWLALAAAFEAQSPGGLPSAWAERLQASLRDLDEEVFRSVSGEPPPAAPPGSSGGLPD
jgi:hypothetical protein